MGTPVGADVDVFVSYTGADEAWATWVAEVLEAEGQRVKIQAWDSPAGENFVLWISEQMAAAARTVAICSQAYFASHWCAQEWSGALADKTLTPLRVESCTLPPMLATIVYRDLHGIDEATARCRLVEAVGLARPPRRSGGFPGGPTLLMRATFPGGQPSDTKSDDDKEPTTRTTSVTGEAARPVRRPRRPRNVVAAAVALALVPFLIVLVVTRAGGAGGSSPPPDFALASRTLADVSRRSVGVLSLRLATAAYKLNPTPEARVALLRAADSSLASLGPPLSASYNGRVTDLSWSPDGTFLTAVGLDSTIRIWDLVGADSTPRDRQITPAHDASVTAVAVSPDSAILATSSDDTTAKLWSVSPASSPKVLATIPTGSKLFNVTFSPDGDTLALSSTDGTVQLWDIHDRANPQLLSALQGHSSAVWKSVFRSDGRTLATISWDNTAKFSFS
ncbi:toll/interleukin-1 receptor domain-containing protein [Parafrankia discariae]|uniref:toll/interleukin-1 receptor domain-containing protein n=1 Tax=Parafrankia discariae TaxID=365528 RepID=UPI00036660EC|nr:TIR domain-containing protein [Parafrankia discariae]